MPNIKLTLTEGGHKSILQKGVFETFKNFSVTDDGTRYDITEPANLSYRYTGGLRDLVTASPTCTYASSKPLSKTVPTEQERIQSTKKLEWEISRLDDCATTYTATNPVIEVNLRTWFNYLTTTIGTENYNYNNRLVLSLFDNIKAIEKQLNPATYTYDQVTTYNDLDMSYVLDTPKSCEDYKNINSYIMTVVDGKKVLSTTTNNRFWSPFLLTFDTEQGQAGGSDNLKMSLGVVSYGYAGILTNSTETTFRKNNFYSISEIESKSVDEINKQFKLLRPAVITSKSNSNSDLYVLEDLLGTYSEGTDMLPTYAQRYKNSDGQYLLQGLINKAVNYIQTSFTESTTTPGLYEQTIKMSINNSTVGGVMYNKQSTIGGNIELRLKWDDSSTDDNYDNVVSWI